ncbi:MAG: tRNA (N(6)-L-threonylcarbamoyladenosine(37)-C(2))-methylthiotransferase MtaB [Flavobacteriaceae bacterium]|nr:tRNA (N(6)-L-threonylcarbamoyladenosine(37)-C(2))-methylthiotransferase MtaB [Flavobacteriaceae bacterium]
MKGLENSDYKRSKIKIAFYTLGCKLNFSETSSISRTFSKDIYTIVPFNSKADIYIINSCSVTDNADKKTKSLVNKVLKINVNGFIVAIGCYAQLKPKEISEIEGIDLVIGANEKFRLVEYINDLYEKKINKINSCDISKVNFFNDAYSLGENRTRSFLKVQDGCDYKCTYCTIPLARGVSRSDSVKNIISNVHKIAKEGIKEVVLTGVNIGDYGKRINTNKNDQNNFQQLIFELDKISSIYRYRISSIEPNLLNDDIIEFVSKSKKFVPHFHIPLQSGSDKVLKKMKRRYLTNLFSNRVKTIKKYMPNSCIGVDVIVGFPGENEKEFIRTYNYLSKLDISYLHVFKYSERSNTEALNYSDVIPGLVRKKRSNILRELSLMKRKCFYESQIGKKLNILFESENKNGFIEGYTENYIKVREYWNPKKINTVQKRVLKSIDKMGFCRI